jgi:hypothetical protein
MGGGAMGGKGRNSSQNTEQQKGDQQKKKAAEDAYKAGLQKIPDAKGKITIHGGARANAIWNRGDIIAVNCKSSGYIEAWVTERQREPRRGNFVVNCKCIATSGSDAGVLSELWAFPNSRLRPPPVGRAPHIIFRPISA